MSHPVGLETFGPPQGPYPLQEPFQGLHGPQGPLQGLVIYMTPSSVSSYQTKYEPPPYSEVEQEPVRENILTTFCSGLEPLAKCLCLSCSVGVSVIIILTTIGFVLS